MTNQPLLEIDVNGQAPDLAGAVCEAILLQQYVFAGTLEDPANVIHLKFSGQWHRLYFDYGIVFWRLSDTAPEAWSDTDEQWDNPLFDLGATADLAGLQLDRYAMTSIHGGSEVSFMFVGGRTVVFKSINDHTSYHVI